MGGAGASMANLKRSHHAGVYGFRGDIFDRLESMFLLGLTFNGLTA